MRAPVRRGILIYAGAFLVAAAAPFLLLPILTAHLTPQQFGEVTSFLIWTTLVANLAGLSVHGFISVRYFKDGTEKFRTLVSSSLAAVGAAHLVALILVVTLYSILVKALELSFHYALIAVLASLFLSMSLQFLAIFQVSGKPWLYLHSRGLQAGIEFTLCLALLFLGLVDAGARIYSYVLALMASAMFGMACCLRLGYVGRHMDVGALKALLHFSAPMLPHIVAGTVITYLDRLVVSSLLGTENLGIYMVAMQFGMAMIMLIEPLNKALTPWLFEQLNKDLEDVRRQIVKRTYQVFIGLASLGILFSYVVHHLFEQMIDASFSPARPLIPWIIAGFVMQGMYYTQVNYLFYAEHTGRLSLITGSTAIFGCLISWGMTSAFGLHGAAASYFVNNTLLFILVWVAASRAVPMPWRLGR